MENQIEERIKAFLAVGSGDGSGSGSGSGTGLGSGFGPGFGSGFGFGVDYAFGDSSGSGYGYSSGYGYGFGSGTGEGSGSGSGSGTGEGSGSGFGSGFGDGFGPGFGDSDGCGCGDGVSDGITEFNGMKVWSIDGLYTIIDSIRGNFAKGFILKKDFTLKPCYIAKVENDFAHGHTLRAAFSDALTKAVRNEPPQKRCDKFHQAYPDPDIKIPAKDLYFWHGYLTGSCKAGRDHFAEEHDIDLKNDFFSIRDFITLTRCSYGSNVIAILAEKYGINNLKK